MSIYSNVISIRWSLCRHTHKHKQCRKLSFHMYFIYIYLKYINEHFPWRTAHNVLPPFEFPLYTQATGSMCVFGWSVRSSEIQCAILHCICNQRFYSYDHDIHIAANTIRNDTQLSRRKQCACEHIAHPSKNISHSFSFSFDRRNVLRRIFNFIPFHAIHIDSCTHTHTHSYYIYRVSYW